MTSSSFVVRLPPARTRALACDLPPEAPKTAPERLSGGAWLIIVFLVLLLISSLAGMVAVFQVGRFPVISLHGWIAMGLGTFLSLALGFGLMWLSFYSSRHGYDDRADPGRKRLEGETGSN